MSKRITKYILVALAVASLVAVALSSHKNSLLATSVPNRASGSTSTVSPQEGNQASEPLKAVPQPPSDTKYTHTTTGEETKDYVRDTFVKSDLGATPEASTVLIVALLANEDAFGARRSVEDFLFSLLFYEHDPNAISLAFLCGTQSLYETMVSYTEKWLQTTAPSYRKVTLIRAPFLDSDFKASDHTPSRQKERRRLIARARNFVLFNSLENEEFTLFLDADIVQMASNDFLTRFINSGKDIIVPRVQKGVILDYDKNSWRGERKVPSVDQLQMMDTNQWDKFKFIPMDVPGKMYHLEDHVKILREKDVDPALRDLDYSVELDSVGGAVLFVKSIIFKQGVVFPTTYIVGTTWERQEGYDGIETEGICYVAKVLGYKCWAMPNVVAYHSLG